MTGLEPGIAAALIGGLGSAGIAAMGSKKKDKAPEPSAIPTAPEPLPVAPTVSGEADKMANFARDAEKRRAKYRNGAGANVLTGSLGVTGATPTSRTTLLGG